jgi:hypothetical protein
MVRSGGNRRNRRAITTANDARTRSMFHLNMSGDIYIYIYIYIYNMLYIICYILYIIRRRWRRGRRRQRLPHYLQESGAQQENGKRVLFDLRVESVQEFVNDFKSVTEIAGGGGD